MTFAGRIEALYTVPSSITASATNSGGGPTSVGMTAGSYFHTAVGTVSGGIATLQSVLNSTRAPSPGAWSVSLSTGASGDGRVTIDCTSGAVLTKTSGADTTWNAGASSVATFTGDGFVETTALEVNKYRMIGLSTADPDVLNTSIQYAIQMDGAAGLNVYESGTLKFSTTYAANDVLRVQRSGSSIIYVKNGATIYTSASFTASALMIDTSLYNTNATLCAIRLYSSGAYQAITWQNSANVTATATTFSLAWTSTTLRDLLGFTADITTANTPQTGTKQAKGLWRPDCPLFLAKSTTKMAPIVTDKRTTIGPTGVSYSLKGTKRYEHASAKWQLIAKSQIEESAATYANGSLEQFLKDTQWGEGHSYFSVGSLIQVYDNDGHILGQDLNSGAGCNGWTWIDSDKFMAERTDQRGYDGLWTVEIPRLVSSG